MRIQITCIFALTIILTGCDACASEVEAARGRARVNEIAAKGCVDKGSTVVLGLDGLYKDCKLEGK